MELLLLLCTLSLVLLHDVVAHPSSLPQDRLEKRGDGYGDDFAHIVADGPDAFENFYQFITRPDIVAPRWDVRVYDQSAVSKGYWFVGPYTDPAQDEHGGGWVGPHIYDGTGELVWSGAPQMSGWDAFDFRVANVLGEDRLTMMFRRKKAMVLDEKYQVLKELTVSDVDDRGIKQNMHDVNFVDDGTKALLLKTITKKTTTDISQIGGYEGRCKVRFYGFEELDVDTLEPVFTWSSEGIIDLDETVFTKKVDKYCEKGYGWDYLHANSIDKFPDGDYLLSGRHTNTLYKISGKDGSIVWRVGGKRSDFEFDGDFSGQHHSRVVSQNTTHTVLSLLDNALVPNGEPRTTNDFSRALVLMLHTDEKPMRAEVARKIDHPHADYAPGRGSHQILPNNNTFVGWTTRALHSEHDSEGNMVMEASMKIDVKSYRNYKFPWVGRPIQPPDVHAVGVALDNDTVTTVVHVSWNGATEVATWNLYRMSLDEKEKIFVGDMPRTGFETTIVYDGFASHVVVEALDRHGNSLGESKVIKTIPPSNILNPAVVEEERWQMEHAPSAASSFSTSSIIAFVLGIALCAALSTVGALIWMSRDSLLTLFRSRRTKTSDYEHVWDKEDMDLTLVEEDDEMEEKDKSKYSETEVGD